MAGFFREWVTNPSPPDQTEGTQAGVDAANLSAILDERQSARARDKFREEWGLNPDSIEAPADEL